MSSTCVGGWTPASGQHPWPPANVMVVHSFMPGCLDIRWDDPSTLNTGPTFTPTQATGSMLIYGTLQTVVAATATVSVGGTPISAGNNLVIGGVLLTAVNAARTPGLNNFNGSLGTVALIAQDIADAINDFANAFRTFVTATAAAGSVFLTAVTPGTVGNSIDLSSTTPNLAPSGGTLSGGLDADTVTIAGIPLTAVSVPRTSGSRDFQGVGSSFAIAASLADAINDPANGLTPYVTATADSGKVTLTAVATGVLGNSVTLETSTSQVYLSGDTLTGGVGLILCSGKSNSEWTIVGVNVYRSDTGERGPYFRVNSLPIGGQFFRDCTSNVLVQNEIVDWEYGWIDRGDAGNNRRWRFRTRFKPIVKRDGQAIPADAPSDVTVSIDGVVVPVDAVAGLAAEIDLINISTYDPSTESTLPPVLPAPDGSSTVLVTYHRQGNLVKTDMEMKAKIHYRVTTVAVDPTGTNPSGLVETPLGYAPAVSPIQTEELDYIWREAIRRNRWILEQGGERVKLFIRRETGIRCTCAWNERLFEYTKQPVNNCEACFGTGFLGGYEGPIDIIIAPDEGERAVRQTPMGRRLEHTYEVWTGPTPLLSQRDFIVKQNGERFSIGPVRRTQVRGVVLQQAFNIGYLDECDIRYRVPVLGISQLPWPETRYTRPQDVPCLESDPYPVGYDYQATQMATEHANIPDGREQRGRTPVWANLTYGGGQSSGS